MSTVEVTNNDVAGVVVADDLYQQETLTVAGATTVKAGTVLGRITASGKLTPWDPGAGDGSEVPKAVTTVEVDFAGAGDAPLNALINGRVRNGKMVKHGTTDALTLAQRDQLRNYGIITVDTRQLAELDNQ